MMTTTTDRLGEAKHGALVGVVVAIVMALLGESGAAIIRSAAFMADVAIAGFTAVCGLPASVALGSIAQVALQALSV